DARVVGTLFACDLVRPSVATGPGYGGPPSGVVSESGADLLRHVGVGAPAALAGQYFLAIACQTRRGDSSKGVIRSPDRHACLRSVIWTKSNLESMKSTEP